MTAIAGSAGPPGSGLEPPPESGIDERRNEFARRTELVRDALARGGVGGVLLRTRHNFAWLTVGGVNHVVASDVRGAAPLLVTAGETVVLAPVNEAARLRDEELVGLPIEVLELPWHEPATTGVPQGRVGARVADDDEMEEILRPVRSVLAPLEHRRLAWLGERARLAVQEALAGAAPGDPEDAIAGRLLARLAMDGIRAPVLLAAADERIARYRHPLPSQRALQGRLMIVVVAERWGLHVALSRFREFAPPEAETARRMAAVNEVLAAMFDATQPRNTLGDVLEAGRAAYARVGFPGEWRLHHQGGSIGYRTRERIAVPGDPTPIVPGNAFAWNPSITGTKAEETGYLTPSGVLRLVTADAEERGATPA